MRDPIFISGLRKSGTSLVKSLLDGHPDLFVFPANELHLFRYSWHPSMVKDKLARLSDPVELLWAVARNTFISRMANPEGPYHLREFDYNRFKEVISSREVEGLKDVYETLMKAMYTSLYGKELPSNLLATSKTVLETEYFPEWLNMFSGCRFVYVLRNPYAHFVSVVRSLRTHAGKSKNKQTYEGMPLNILQNPYPFLGPELIRMRNSYHLMRKYAELYPGQFYILVYDDLLLDPEGQMRKLCKFLGISYRESLLQPTILGKQWRGNSWFGGDFEAIDPGPLYHWKKYIHPGEIKILNRYFSEVIEHYFEPLEPGGSLIQPFHASEYKPWVYLGNRLLYYLGL